MSGSCLGTKSAVLGGLLLGDKSSDFANTASGLGGDQSVLGVFCLGVRSFDGAAANSFVVNDTLTFVQTVTADRSGSAHTQTVTQNFSFAQTVSTGPGTVLTNSLGFAQTLSYTLSHHQFVSDKFGFIQTAPHTNFGRFRDSLVFVQTVRYGASFATTCDTGTLGDTNLGDYALGSDCGADGPNGSAVQTLLFVQKLVCKQLHSQTVRDVFVLRDTVAAGPSVRHAIVADRLAFSESGTNRSIAIGSGTAYTYQQPAVTATIVRPTTIFLSRQGALVLPSAQFDDSAGANNLLTTAKMMTRRTFSYVRRSNLDKLVYTFLLSRAKALELRAYYAMNVAEYISLTNWKGEVFIGKFSNSPLVLTTTGRFENEYEKVTAEIEFQGVRVHG